MAVCVGVLVEYVYVCACVCVVCDCLCGANCRMYGISDC